MILRVSKNNLLGYLKTKGEKMINTLKPLPKRVSILFAILCIICICVIFHIDNIYADDNTPSAIMEHDFETESEEWVPSDDGVKLTLDSSRSHNGNKSLKAYDRVNAFSGPSIDITDKVVFGNTYSVSLWFYYSSTGTDTAIITLKSIFSDGSEHFDNVRVYRDSSPDTWIHMEGTFSVREKTVQAILYAESHSADSTIWIDDFTMSCKEDNTASSFEASSLRLSPGETRTFSFENETEGWKAFSYRYEPKITRSSTVATKGEHSLYVYDRTECRDGAAFDISGLEKSREYSCTASITFFDKTVDKETFCLTLEYFIGNVRYNLLIDTHEIQSTSWSSLGMNSKFTIPEEARNPSLIISTVIPENETEYTHISFYVDEISLKELSIANWNNKIRNVVIISVTLVVLAAILSITGIFISHRRKSEITLKDAQTDAMTHAYNRNAYEDTFNTFIKSPKKCKSYYFAVCDVNGLKKINDELGHSFGDKCIIKCASVLLSVIKEPDGKVFRTGGDEFICISRKNLEKEITEALKKAESEEKEYPFSAAVGFASYNPDEDGKEPDIRDIIVRCDRQMYIDKKKYH